MKTETKVVKDPENIIPVEVFEQAIIDISKGIKKLNQSKLSKRAIYVLVQDSVPSGVGMTEIVAVISALENLEKKYIKS